MKKKRSVRRILILSLACVLMIAGGFLIGNTYYEYQHSRNKEVELMTAFNKIVSENQNKEAVINNVTIEIPEDNEVNDILEAEIAPEVIEDETEELPEERTIDYSQYENYTIVGKMEIPDIEQLDIILEGDSLKILKVGLGHFPETVMPGEEGNFAVCGHAGSKYGVYFSYLYKLKNGQQIKVTDMNGNEFTYEITNKYVVEATDFSVLDQPTDGSKIITLITCTSGGKQRLIIRGTLVE